MGDWSSGSSGMESVPINRAGRCGPLPAVLPDPQQRRGLGGLWAAWTLLGGAGSRPEGPARLGCDLRLGLDVHCRAAVPPSVKH